eukprot:6192652-Pleurochrysis_carterae.AAC.3
MVYHASTTRCLIICTVQTGDRAAAIVAALEDSLQSTDAGCEKDPYRPWEQLAALTLTQGMLLDT